MKVLYHHIYEYKKGLRNLVLHTLPRIHKKEAEDKLRDNDISYVVRIISSKKINIFFGARECVSIVSGFGDKPLYDFSDEEDFILGIMLGYNRLDQCRRYFMRRFAGTDKKENSSGLLSMESDNNYDIPE